MRLNIKVEALWIGLGFLGQFLFFLRFFIQWITSERNKKSVIPIAFWYCSLIGGCLLLLYALHKRDPVFILGQSCGLLVYARNLHLIYLKKQQEP